MKLNTGTAPSARWRKGPGDGRDHPLAPKVFLMRREAVPHARARDLRPADLGQGRAKRLGPRGRCCGEVTPRKVLQDPDRNCACGLSDRKTEYIADLAQHFADGRIHVHRWPEMSDEEIIAELVEVRGIGRWTAEMFLIFNLLRPDVFPLDDLGLQKGMSKLFQGEKGFAGAHAQAVKAGGRGARWPPGTCGARSIRSR